MSENKTADQKKVSIQIQIDDDVAQGLYTNLAMVNHNETEFTLDFIFVQPQQPRAKVRARIISSPKHTKRLLEALKDNVTKYEKRFGTIDISGPSPQEEFLNLTRHEQDDPFFWSTYRARANIFFRLSRRHGTINYKFFAAGGLCIKSGR